MTPKASAFTTQGRLMVVSNRAPFRIVREAGTNRIEPTVGGVATTFLHLLELHGGLWIAWSGGTDTPPALEIPMENPRFSILFSAYPKNGSVTIIGACAIGVCGP